jgi:hypothetical protein
MKIYQLKTELWLPQPRAEIFQFFANPANLERLTPGCGLRSSAKVRNQ